MDKSIFDDKNVTPCESTLKDALGDSYVFWKTIHDYVHLKYPKAVDEWKYSGIKYGWSFWIKDKKRVIIYLLPRDTFFRVAMVFGKKAVDEIMNADVSVEIKDLLVSAIVYAEGRGIRFDVRDESNIRDIRKLIDIKLS